MKKLTLILMMLLPIQLIASNYASTDTIRIVVNGNTISIEADDPKEIEELLQHDIQQLFKNIYLNLNKDTTSDGTPEIQNQKNHQNF